MNYLGLLKLKRKIITNSLGFRDSAKKNLLNKQTDKTRILLIGDSFIEGSGYLANYEYTLSGLLANTLGNRYEVF